MSHRSKIKNTSNQHLINLKLCSYMIGKGIMASSLKTVVYIISLKKKIMNNKKLKTKIQAIIASGLVLFFIACNNSDYTKSPAKDSGNTPANNDTAINNKPVTDTSATRSSIETPKSKQGTAMRKKRK